MGEYHTVRSKKTCCARVCLLGFLLLSCFPGGPVPARSAQFVDALGRKIRLDTAPQRIVPLAPSLTEILYALGLGGRIVGTTRFSTYPPEAASKPRIGAYNPLNVEKIITLAPDLVIATADGNSPTVVALLEEARIPVFVLNPRNVRQVIETMAVLGRVCGVPERGEDLSGELAGRVDRVVRGTAGRERPLVFLQINIKPIMSVNRKTFHHDLIHLAGGTNMTRDETVTYPRISLEEVIRREPEVILISSMERGGRFEKGRRGWLTWSSIPAVRAGRVHLIDSDLIDRPSPRMVTGLEEMARLIHPEVSWP